MELRKENPASTTYQIDSSIGSTKLIDRSRAHTFQNSFDAY